MDFLLGLERRLPGNHYYIAALQVYDYQNQQDKATCHTTQARLDMLPERIDRHT